MPLPLVAIAGGTSQLGRAIVTACLNGGAYLPIVLSREASSTPQWLLDLGIEIRRVDYLSVDSCRVATRGVDTLISTLLCKDGTWYTSQKNLLDAGLKNGMKRMVPSEFGLGPSSTPHIDLFAGEQMAIRKDLREAALENPGFEWTAFFVGQFTNYLGYGCDSKDAVGMDHSLLWNVKEMTVDIPVQDDGTVPQVTMTTIADVGRFVAAACTLPHGSWPEETYLSGQTLSMTEIVDIVEKVRGRKMTVRKNTISSIQAQIDSIPADSQVEDDLMARFFLQLTSAFVDPKSAVMPPELNEKFPNIETTSVETYVTRCWADV